jgi:hypothetical protein
MLHRPQHDLCVCVCVCVYGITVPDGQKRPTKKTYYGRQKRPTKKTYYGRQKRPTFYLSAQHSGDAVSE